MATDLSKYSDEELEKIASQKAKPDLSSMSDEDLEAIASGKAKQQAPSAGKSALIGLQSGTLFGARPFVAGVAGGMGAAAGTEGGLADRFAAFKTGFSDAKLGAREEEALSAQTNPKANLLGQAAGTVLTAPLTAIKGIQTAKNAKSIFQGLKTSGQIGAGMGAAQALGNADDASDAIEMIGTGALLGGALQVGGNTVSKYGKSGIEAVGRGARTVASNLTGIPEKTIQTYANRAADITKQMSRAGGDISEAADQARTKITQEVQVARQKLNQKIGSALADPQLAGIKIEGAPLLKAVDEQIAKIGGVTANFRPGEISELKNVRDSIAKSLSEDGTIPPQLLHELKQELQIIASPAYNNGAMIFPKGDLAARGAKGAAAEAKRLLDVAVPELAKANQQLSRLHVIEQNMNKNLVRAGKPEAALIAAGSGTNPRNAKTLSSLDSITGGTALEQAENLAAGKTFGNVSFNPMDATGKAVARMATGAGVGYATGGEHGAIIGTALTSPAALKFAIDSARFAGRMGNAFGGGAVKNAISSIPQAEARAALTNQGLMNRTESRAADSAISRRLNRLRGNGQNSKPGAK